jgi:hypothetical protein
VKNGATHVFPDNIPETANPSRSLEISSIIEPRTSC